MPESSSRPRSPTDQDDEPEGESDEGLALPGEERRPGQTDDRGLPIPSLTEEAPDDEAPIEGVVISPDAYSQGEVIRHRDFDRMTPSELREAERLIDLLEPRLERRRTRRYELHSHGRRLAPRAMFRRNSGPAASCSNGVWRDGR